ncbi:UDP-N-acetylmuramoyl-tripeptide--D-alanyl-D-alanine ligase [bacterium]|nr:UDP-N-acetylmuramoyl-tripeptide--D-alanyl-D-alanine ligase [bacterium]
MTKGASQILDVDLIKYAKRYRQKLNCKVIAVTGSFGKTTVKDMLYYMLKDRFKVVRTEQNQNNEIGVPLTVLKADYGTDILIVEMGMRNPGDMALLTQIVRPTHVVVTGIGLTHMAQFKQPRDIARAKGEIFRQALTWEKGQRMAAISHESSHYAMLAKKAESKGYRVFPYTGQTGPDQNVNLCYLLGRQLGVSDNEIEKGLKGYSPSDHRLNRIKVGGVTIVDDSYNANPDGVRFALESIKTLRGRRLLVLGDMLELGRFETQAHSDLVDPILDAGIAHVFALGKAVRHIPSDRLSIEFFEDISVLNQRLKAEVKSGDVILVKGSRGLALEKCVSFLKAELDS